MLAAAAHVQALLLLLHGLWWTGQFDRGVPIFPGISVGSAVSQ